MPDDSEPDFDIDFPKPPPPPQLKRAAPVGGDGDDEDGRDEWAERMAELRREREQRWSKKRSGGSCGGCIFKLILFLGVAGVLLFLAHRELKERDMLPDWFHLPHWSWTLPSKGWDGYAAADRSHRSPNFYSRDGRAITSIVLHCTESSSAMSAINHFEKTSSKVSAHYILARNGVLYQMVDEKDQAWHCREANGHTVGIEIVGLQHQLITPEQSVVLSSLIRDIMLRHGVSRSRITGHDFTPQYTGQTTCPDFLFGGNKREHLEKWLQKYLDPALADPP